MPERGSSPGLVAQAKRGTPLVALLVGPIAEAEKTAAGLAEELSRDLHRVDLRRVISRYVGETEKNLQALLDRAAAADAVLFFDEADALFGRRTEVRESHDRYANLEVSHLLHLLTEHPGLVLLATGSAASLDEEVRRRSAATIWLPDDEADTPPGRGGRR